MHGGSGAPPALGRRDDGARSLGAAPAKQSALLARAKGMHFRLYIVPFHANLTRPYRLRCLEAFEAVQRTLRHTRKFVMSYFSANTKRILMLSQNRFVAFSSKNVVIRN